MNLIYEEIKYIIARNIVKSLIIMYFFSIFLSITNTLFFSKNIESPYFYIFNSFLLLLYIYIFYKDEYEWLYELSSYIFQKKYTNEIESTINRYIDLNSKIENNSKFSEIEKELRKKEAKIDYEEEIKYIIKKKKERKEKNKKFIFGVLKYLVIPIVVGVLIAIIIKKLNL
jgi:Ca2+/Na+ antiporter